MKPKTSGFRKLGRLLERDRDQETTLYSSYLTPTQMESFSSGQDVFLSPTDLNNMINGFLDHNKV